MKIYVLPRDHEVSAEWVEWRNTVLEPISAFPFHKWDERKVFAIRPLGTLYRCVRSAGWRFNQQKLLAEVVYRHTPISYFKHLSRKPQPRNMRRSGHRIMRKF